MLGLSSDAIDADADIEAVMGEGDAGLPAAVELVEFAEAAWRDDATLAAARDAVRSALGSAALVEAAMTVAIFRSLNIAADATGIPLDDDFAGAAHGLIETLGLDRFPTAANSPSIDRSDPA